MRDDGVDGCDETAGIDVTARLLGPAFPGGLFACHDGSDDDEGDPTTNFELVPLGRFEAAIQAHRG